MAHSCPIFWFRGLQPSDGYPGCQPRRNLSPRISVRWTSLVGMFSQTEAEEQKTGVTASVDVAVAWLGSLRTVVLSTRWEAGQAFYTAKLNP